MNFPPSLVGKGVRGLGQSLAFPHNVKSQIGNRKTTKPNAPCPMPNAQCPMPHAQCPMPNAQIYL
ncbi:MAG: hypothetical protein V7K68_18115 [Nostoc sp.]|uniref:hypothetical protein n=1 Tax=Nostoc sp. TaxID=1180 RepID=UPI002FF90920